MAGAISTIPLGTLQEILEQIEIQMKSGTFAEKMQAMTKWRETAELYNNTFYLLSGCKTKEIYNTQYRG